MRQLEAAVRRRDSLSVKARSCHSPPCHASRRRARLW